MPDVSDQARRERADAERKLAQTYGWPSPATRKIDRTIVAAGILAAGAIFAMLVASGTWQL